VVFTNCENLGFPSPYIITNRHWVITSFCHQWADQNPETVKHYTGQPFDSILTEESANRLKSQITPRLHRYGFAEDFELDFIDQHQQITSKKINAVAMDYEAQGVSLVLMIIAETKHQANTNGLNTPDASEAKKLLQVTFDTIDQGVTIWDHKYRLVAWNRRFEQMRIIPPSLYRKGQSLRDIYKVIAETGIFGEVDPEHLVQSHVQSLKTGDIKHYEEFKIRDKRTIAIRRYMLPSHGGLVAVLSDISERKAFETRLRKKARYCELTKLPNREALNHSTRLLIKRANKQQQSFSLLFIDLDRFKTINDARGHISGDQLLIRVADLIKQHLKAEGLLARFGGDEFCLLTRRYPTQTQAHQASMKIAHSLTVHLSDTPVDKDSHLYISASIGIAQYPKDGSSFKELLNKADIALSDAKSRGTGQITSYHSILGQQVKRRAEIERKIRSNLAKESFQVVFQPKVNLADNQVSGFEALARLSSNEPEQVGPSTFIPIAEQSGLINQLSMQIIEKTAAHLNCWKLASFDPGQISLNISPVQFRDPKLIQRLMLVLEKHHISPTKLELEITETALMADREFSIRTINELKNEGFDVALDDFGIGYSSLDYLIDLPIDRLKIDRIFIQRMSEKARMEKIVCLLVQLSNDLNLQVTAEGVETIEQARQLKEMGCDEIQGFLYSPPITASAVQEMKAQHNLLLL